MMAAHVRTRQARGERGLTWTPKRSRAQQQLNIGATKLGLSADEYRQHVEAGERWCSGHRAWHPATLKVFAIDRNHSSGLAGNCRAWLAERYAARRKP